MNTTYFVQPDIDPVLFHIWGPLSIRWYSLLYVGGFILARWILIRLAKEPRFKFTPADIEQFIVWLLVGTVIGARVFYCVVYDPQNLLRNPFYLFETYKGGLSFHGGLIGGILAAILFCRKRKSHSGISPMRWLLLLHLVWPWVGLEISSMVNSTEDPQMFRGR